MQEELELDKTLWEGYEEWLDEQAARNFYERMEEM